MERGALGCGNRELPCDRPVENVIEILLNDVKLKRRGDFRIQFQVISKQFHSGRGADAISDVINKQNK